jgi:hypothetical protein
MTRNSSLTAGLATAALAALLSLQYIGTGAPVEQSAPGYTAGESNDVAAPSPTVP